jgi:hypothetical protein
MSDVFISYPSGAGWREGNIGNLIADVGRCAVKADRK